MEFKIVAVFLTLLVLCRAAKIHYENDDSSMGEVDAIAFAKKMSLEEKKNLSNGCIGVSCKSGRVCQTDDEGTPRCVCGKEDHCRRHRRKVCGSDGVYYKSHCELHRVSCIQGSHLGVDQSNKRCQHRRSTSHETTTVPKIVPTIKVTTKVVKKEEHPTTTTTTPKSAEPKVCNPAELKEFKEALLNYHCDRIGQTDCFTNESKKTKIVTELFDFFDKDENKFLMVKEMQEVMQESHMNELSMGCKITDLFVFEDFNEDGIINIEEFYRVFGLYDNNISDEPAVPFTTLVTVGNALELKCNLQGVEKVVWKRMGVELKHSDEIKIFDDNSMYIGDLQLHHMGNYSCHDYNEDSFMQLHVIIVQMPPVVKVFPLVQMLPQGSLSTLRCHVDSVPHSEVQWFMNGKVVNTDTNPQHPMHLFLQENNTTLKVRSKGYNMSKFTCEARNSAGVSQESASLTFLDEPSTDFSSEPIEKYMVFHDDGYSVHDFSNCSILQTIDKDFQVSLSSIITPLCGAGVCDWGDGVMVGEELLYIMQPVSQRVLVIDVVDRMNPIEVIKLDETPIEIFYISHTDQVWLTLCVEKQVVECGKKVVKVIQRANRSIQHRAVSMKDSDDSYVHVDKLFLPGEENFLNEKFTNGFYTDPTKKSMLHQFDMLSMQKISSLDLEENDCIPVHLAYVPIGGYLFVSCSKLQSSVEANSHLIIDYITSKVIKKSDIGGGKVFVSPDSRSVVVLQENGNVFSVYKLTADGRLNHLFDEYTEMHLNHLSFFKSANGYGYNCFAVSYKDSTILRLDLALGKVTLINGPEKAFNEDDLQWNKRHRKLLKGRLFMDKMATSSRTSVTALSTKTQNIQCHWQKIKNPVGIYPLPLEQNGLKY